MELSHLFRYFKKHSNPKEDNTSAMLVRSFSYRQAFRTWLAKHHHNELLKSIYTSFTLSKVGVQGDFPLSYFPLRTGDQIHIHYLDALGKNTFPYLMDYFRDRIMRLGYKLYLSDKQIINHQSHSARMERHILHPRKDLAIAGQKLPQLYGNIELRVQFIDDKPIYLSILTEPFDQSNYSRAYPFDELAELLFI